MTADDLLNKLAYKGGVIVGTNVLTEYGIVSANACDLMYVNKDALGFVLLPNYVAHPNFPLKTGDHVLLASNQRNTKDNESCVGTFHCPICMVDTPHNHEGLASGKKWIGVDFDGVLVTEVRNRKDPYVFGDPIPEMVNRVKGWIASGYTVKLLTSRMAPYSHTAGKERDVDKMRAFLQLWCIEHLGKKLECTNQKDGGMEVIWDDRAVQVVRNQGKPILFNKGAI